MSPPSYRWERVTEEAAFAPRDGAGALTVRGRMFLLGGWNPGDKVHFPKICNSEVWSSADGAHWDLVNRQAPWEGRHTAGYVVHRDRMWIVGGDGNQGHYQNDVWSSADGVTWECVNDRVPWGPRVLHYTVAFNGRIWVMGGQTIPQFAPEREIFYSDVWSSEDGKHWERVLDGAPCAPRGMIGGTAVMSGRMWILGGGTYDTSQRPDRIFYNDVWSSADGVHWEQVARSTPWGPRQYHDVAVFDNRLWVMEGYGMESGDEQASGGRPRDEESGRAKAGNRNDVWHSADGVTWHEVPNTPWLPRHAASVFVHDDALWMVAGNNMTPDAWKLTRV